MPEVKLDLSELAEYAQGGSNVRYHYAVITVPLFAGEEEFEQILNFMGSHSWELVHTLDLTNKLRLTFKRVSV